MSGVDQLFDRFGDLLRSWTTQSGSSPFSEPRRGSGDPFLDEAMAELDAFLDDDKEAEERLRREREAREARDRAYGSSARPSGQARPSGPPAKLVAAYKTLGLSYGAPFPEAKASYKRLLKQHHPDKHGADPVAQKKATETSSRINDAFRIIETWHERGTLGDE